MSLVHGCIVSASRIDKPDGGDCIKLQKGGVSLWIELAHMQTLTDPAKNERPPLSAMIL